MTPLVRPAQVSDADAIGVLHVQAWLETYTGLIPANLLQSLSPVQRAEMWRGWLTRGAGGAYVCEEGQAVVGFGLCGAQRTRTLPNHRGEVYAINILRRAQGRGLGRALMQAMARSLDERGLAPMTLMVLAQNVSARQFYYRLGGRVIGEIVSNFGGARLPELVYGWDDLSTLTKRR
jgi:ribosomal protein S18 acetylase RimI-like enzyme